MKTKFTFPTWEKLEAMLERDNLEGFCIGCGSEASGIEPDAEGYECDTCGKCLVFGAEQLLILGMIREEGK